MRIEITEANQPFDLTVKMPNTSVLDVHEKQLNVKHPVFSQEKKKCNMKISVDCMTSACMEAKYLSH